MTLGLREKAIRVSIGRAGRASHEAIAASWVARLGNDARVVPPGRQQERKRIACQQVELVHGSPRGDVVVFRANYESRNVYVGQRDGPATDAIATLGELVMQKQAPQRFRVKAAGQPSSVLIPRYQVIGPNPFTQ